MVMWFQLHPAAFGMQDFLKLQVWHKAHAVEMDIHRLTQRLRGRDMSVLRGQLERSSLSITSNIAEGAGKITSLEFARFLEMAIASASETQSQLISARDRGLLDAARHDELAGRVTEVRRMLFGLIKRVRGSDPNNHQFPQAN
jgi:four helix bundle protein